MLDNLEILENDLPVPTAPRLLKSPFVDTGGCIVYWWYVKQLPYATEEKPGMEFANRADCSLSFRPTTRMRHRSLACQNAFSCKVICWARRPFAPCASAAASILQNGGSPLRTGPVLKKTTKRKSSR